MAFTLQQSPSAGIAGSATSKALTVTKPTSGQLLVCGMGVVSFTATPALATPTDNGSGGWTPFANTPYVYNGQSTAGWWWKVANSTDASSLTTITFSWTNGSTQNGGSCWMDEFHGFSNTPTLDLSPNIVDNTGVAYTLTGGVASNATELAIGFIGNQVTGATTGTNNYSPNNGTNTYTWTTTATTAGGGSYLFHTTWAAPTASPATHALWKFGVTNAHDYAIGGATFYDGTSSVNPLPAAAPGTGVGTQPAPTPTGVPAAAPASGAGTAATTSTNPTPLAAVGSGAGVSPTIGGATNDVSPPAAAGSGVGVEAFVTGLPVPAAAGTGVGVSPLVNGINATPPTALGTTPPVLGNDDVPVAPTFVPGLLGVNGPVTAYVGLLSPPVAPGTGVGVTPHIGGTSGANATPPIAAGTGVGNATTTTINVTAGTALGTGVGVAAPFPGNVLPAAAPGTGVGVNPAVTTQTTTFVLAFPPTAVGTGAAVSGGSTGATSYHFYPAADNIVPPIYVSVDHNDPWYPVDPTMHRLFRHYDNRPRGRNIFLMSDGTYVDSQIGGTPPNMIQPPTDPYVRVYSPDPVTGLATETDTFQVPYVVRTYYGGTNNVISAAEAAALQAAGYVTN